MLAALFDRKEIAQALIDAGAKTDLADYRGNTPESLAAGQGLKKMLKILSFHRQASKAEPPLKTNRPHKRDLFWVWITYQSLKGVLTLTIIWIPLWIALRR